MQLKIDYLSKSGRIRVINFNRDKMFTGLIQKIGTVATTSRTSGGLIIRIECGELAGDISIGDSVAVNGVCLTATRISGSLADFDVSNETLQSSTTGALRSAEKVNLELAMQAGGRFGGHIVQGHIDGIATIKAIKQAGDFYELSVSAGSEIMSSVVKKGSVAVNGISLTAASIGSDYFIVAVIPTTWKDTTLQYLKAQDKVNIETDLIVKTIRAQIERMLAGGSGGSLTIEKLQQMGF